MGPCEMAPCGMGPITVVGGPIDAGGPDAIAPEQPPAGASGCCDAPAVCGQRSGKPHDWREAGSMRPCLSSPSVVVGQLTGSGPGPASGGGGC